MLKIEKEIKETSDKIASLNKARKKVIREVIKNCSKIIELAEASKISLEQADSLFGYFLHNGDFLPEELDDIITDGASLELPKKWLKGRPKINIKSIKERLMKLNSAKSVEEIYKN